MGIHASTSDHNHLKMKNMFCPLFNSWCIKCPVRPILQLQLGAGRRCIQGQAARRPWLTFLTSRPKEEIFGRHPAHLGLHSQGPAGLDWQIYTCKILKVQWRSQIERVDELGLWNRSCNWKRKESGSNNFAMSWSSNKEVQYFGAWLLFYQDPFKL